MRCFPLMVLCVFALSLPASAQGVEQKVKPMLALEPCLDVAQPRADLCLRQRIRACEDGLAAAGHAAAVYRGCAYFAFELVDRRLNEDYAQAVAKLRKLDQTRALEGPAGTDGLEALLRGSQRAWLTVRDETCELGVRYDMISAGYDAAITACQAEMTARRIHELHDQIGVAPLYGSN